MKIKEGFVLRQVAGSWVVLSLAKSMAEFNGMLTLNESGVLLWRRLIDGASREELISTLTEEYEVTAEIAAADVDKFLLGIDKLGCLEL